MFDEPGESQAENPTDPAVRAKDKADEFRMHAELCAVFEGPRKFDAELRAGLDADLARKLQRTIGKLEKSKIPETPVLTPESVAEATEVLTLAEKEELPTNDYHIHRRPGEVMIVRWLSGDEVDLYYTRLQAHFDVALEQCREDERQAHEWKSDPATKAYLAALDKVEVNMAERYLREPIKTHGLFVLSTQSADELNIAYLADYIMSVPAAEIVGEASAPPDEPTEKDLAWFFKLFSLRGVVEGVEKMCFFAYLQKTSDDEW
ncbi:hypothetical protein [Humisphaera borealis]|uniref:Uncharacterized protein n=1 Tax=Humisphaera borealis TaxID=2807512 RepID=A0A7M2X265_9BACT|nr:hypothetical protein [Humisphaera borealis]QOV91699.1 hypothetical protein IPV69_10175 [Humisphaera borealis]